MESSFLSFLLSTTNFTTRLLIPKVDIDLNIEVKFLIQGTVDLDKAKRAAELSFTKYCSVSKALEYGSNVSYSVYVNGQLA